MADPDLRALCADLTEIVRMPNIEHVADAHNHAVRELKKMAALAQPAPEPPTGAELTALVRVFQAAYNAKRSELRYLPTPYWEETVSDLADHAGISAVLARWGQGNG